MSVTFLFSLFWRVKTQTLLQCNYLYGALLINKALRTPHNIITYCWITYKYFLFFIRTQSNIYDDFFVLFKKI